jgi:hypothetical protein
MTFLILTIGAIAIVMLIMAVGVILKRPCLRGSCGGPEIFDADGEPLSCAACPRRKELEQNLSLTAANAGAVRAEPLDGAENGGGAGKADGDEEEWEAPAGSRQAR